MLREHNKAAVALPAAIAINRRAGEETPSREL
jgi:hypothetical protein